MALPATDAFSYSNNASLPTASGGAWALPPSSVAIGVNSNNFHANANGESCNYWTADTPPDDQYAQVTIAATAGGAAGHCGPAIRINTAAQGYYGVYSGDTTTEMFKMVAGVWTQFGSSQAVCAVSDVLRIEAIGSTIRYLRNGSEVLSFTDSARAGGMFGVCGYASGAQTTNRGDDFEGGEVLPTPNPDYLGSGAMVATATSGAALTPGFRSGWAAGELAILVYHKSNNDDLATPSGWDVISEANNTSAQRVEVFGRILQSGDSAPSLPGAANTTVRGAQIHHYGNFYNTGVVADAISALTRSNNAASATVTYATLTPLHTDTLLAAYAFYEDDPTIFSTITGFGASVRSGSTLGNDMALAYAHREYATTSATGALTQTVSGGTFANSPNVGILIAIRPPSTGATETGAATLSETATLSGAGVRVVRGSVALSNSAMLSAAGKLIIKGASALSNGATLAGSALKIVKAASVLSQGTTLSAAAKLLIKASAAVSQGATLSAAGRRVQIAAAALSGGVTLAGAGRVQIKASGALTAPVAGLSGAARLVWMAAGTFSENATLSGSALVKKLASAVLSQTFVLTPVAKQTFTASATLTNGATLSGAGVRIVYGAAAFSQGAALSAAPHVRIVAAAGLSAPVAGLSGAADVIHLGSAALSQAFILTPSAQQTFIGAATLSNAATLAGAGRLVIRGSVALSNAATLAAVGRQIAPGYVALTNANSLDASGLVIIRSAGVLTNGATLAAVGRRAVPGAAALIADGGATLSAVARLLIRGYVSLTNSSNFTGSARLRIRAVAVLSDGATLVGYGFVVGQAHTGRAEFTNAATLAANGKLIVRATGALNQGASIDAQGRRATLGSVARSGPNAQITVTGIVIILAAGALPQGAILSADGRIVLYGAAALLGPVGVLTGQGFTGPLVDIAYPPVVSFRDSDRRVTFGRGGNSSVAVKSGKTRGELR